MNEAPDIDRRCIKCGARLSSYNRYVLCYPCQEKERDVFENIRYRFLANAPFLNYAKRNISESTQKKAANTAKVAFHNKA